jgi:type III secretion protein D
MRVIKISKSHQVRCHLRVMNGIHADASCELQDELLTIGCDGAASVALLDDGLAARHVTLKRQDDGSLQVGALAEGVRIDGVTLAPNDNRALTAPATIDVGPVRIEILYEQVTAVQDAPVQAGVMSAAMSRLVAGRSTTALIAGVLGAALCAFLIKLMIWPVTVAHAVVATSAVPSHPVIHADQDVLLSDDELGSKVADALRAAHVSGIDITAKTGVVTIQGDVEPAQWDALQKVEQWFDSAYGQRYVLLPNVKKSLASEFVLPLQSVWDGTGANIVVHGQRYGVGSEVQDGYRVVSIANGSIVIAHNGRNSIFRY